MRERKIDTVYKRVRVRVCVMRECVICVCISMGECERMCVYACWVYVCVCKCVHMFVDVDGFVGMSVCVCVCALCACVFMCVKERLFLSVRSLLAGKGG